MHDAVFFYYAVFCRFCQEIRCKNCHIVYSLPILHLYYKFRMCLVLLLYPCYNGIGLCGRTGGFLCIPAAFLVSALRYTPSAPLMDGIHLTGI